MAILPPGVSSVDFTAALGQFAAAVGEDWVLTTDEDLRPYRDHYSPVPLADEELIPSAAVAPTSVEQVQPVSSASRIDTRSRSTLSRRARTSRMAGRRRICAAA